MLGALLISMGCHNESHWLVNNDWLIKVAVLFIWFPSLMSIYSTPHLVLAHRSCLLHIVMNCPTSFCLQVNATCWVSWGEGIGTPYSTGSSWWPLFIVYFHSLLLPSWFIDLWLLLVLVSLDVYPVLFVLNLHKMYVLLILTTIKLINNSIN